LTLSYAVNMAALRHARSLGAEEAIFTAEGRRVLEGATSSVICAHVRDGRRVLVTPEPSHGILPGTTQAKIFTAARRDGWELGYGPLYPADLMGADAVWLVSSVRLAVPVRRLDAQPLPTDPELTRLVTGYVSAA
jgi:4-amino-4-deoxychorismate lyase